MLLLTNFCPSWCSLFSLSFSVVLARSLYTFSAVNHKRERTMAEEGERERKTRLELRCHLIVQRTLLRVARLLQYSESLFSLFSLSLVNQLEGVLSTFFSRTVPSIRHTHRLFSSSIIHTHLDLHICC